MGNTVAVIIIGISTIILGVTNGLQTRDINRLEDKLKQTQIVQKVEKKDCTDYTLKEFREGEAPAKCQAEVYGDQF